MALSAETDAPPIGLNPTVVLRREALGAAVSGLLALLGFWRISSVSWSDLSGLWGQSDAIVEYSMSKTQSHSLFGFFDPHLGFPHGQDWTHFPVLDAANRLELSLLQIFLDPVTAVNVLFALSFPVVAIFMYAALRNLHVGRSLAVVGGVSLSLVGYHFDYEHPFLGNYWAVPVGILWLSVLANTRSAIAGRCKRRTVLVVGFVAAVIVGLHNPQYLVFFSLIGVVAVTIGRSKPHTGLRLSHRIFLLAIPGVTLLAWLVLGRILRTIPSVTPATDRPLVDSYVWAGKFLSLLTTPGDSILSQFPPNRGLLAAQDISLVSGVSALQSAPVAAATVVVIGLVVVFIANVWKPVGVAGEIIESARPWVAMWVVAASFFVTGGMGFAFAALVSPQIRGWARLAVILAALALTASLIFASGWMERWKARPSTRSKVLSLTLAGGLGLIFLDQFTAQYPVLQDSVTLPALESLVSSANGAVTEDCAILNVPVMGFPEALPPGQTRAYDQLLPYVAGIPGPFSYGAIRGQLGSRWTDHLAVQPTQLAQQAASEGFCAILVDSYGLDANSPGLVQYEEALGAPMSTAMNRWALFTLPSATRVKPRDSLFSKPEVNYGSDFTAEKVSETGEMGRWTRGSEASIKVWNPGEREMEWIASTTIAAANCSNDQSVEILTNSGFKQDFVLAPGEQREVFVPLQVPSQSNVTLTFVTKSQRCEQEGEMDLVGVAISDLRYSTNQQPGADIAAFEGFHQLESAESGDMWRWIEGKDGSIQVFSTSSKPTTVVLSGQLQAPLCAPADVVQATMNEEVVVRANVTPWDTSSFEVLLILDPFESETLNFSSASDGCFVEGDDRLLGPKVQNLSVASSQVAP